MLIIAAYDFEYFSIYNIVSNNAGEQQTNVADITMESHSKIAVLKYAGLQLNFIKFSEYFNIRFCKVFSIYKTWRESHIKNIIG